MSTCWNPNVLVAGVVKVQVPPEQEIARRGPEVAKTKVGPVEVATANIVVVAPPPPVFWSVVQTMVPVEDKEEILSLPAQVPPVIESRKTVEVPDTSAAI